MCFVYSLFWAHVLSVSRFIFSANILIQRQIFSFISKISNHAGLSPWISIETTTECPNVYRIALKVACVYTVPSFDRFSPVYLNEA
ncbi:hypothetical protein JB92DRAFT_2901402 [Gautieria morchelliformis]|nr:hypothetical protein JB92DRAFT_2901402 [Gautieria morchelliformis]